MKSKILLQEENGRIGYFDILKGIGIVLVVWGHCIQYGNGEVFYAMDKFYDDSLFQFIYSFHMPFFMFVSGYLFLFSVQRHDAGSLGVSKFRGLIVPALTYAGVSLAINWNWQEAPHSLVEIKYYVLRQMWFLWGVFYSSIIVLVVHRWFRDKFAVHAVLMILTFVTPDHLHISYYKWTYFYFVAGYYMNSHIGYLQRYSRYSMPIFVCTTLLFILMLQFYDRNIFIYLTGMTILHRASSPLAVCSQLYYDAFRIVIGFLGTFSVSLLVWQSKSFIEKFPRITRLVVTLGRNTLGIYFFQSFITDGGMLTGLTGTLTYSIVMPIFEMVIILFVCMQCIRLAKCFRITRILALGMKE